MYGAILGDIIGSRFEFDRGGRVKEFALFTPEDAFTDDTVMTIAVADALLCAGAQADVQTIRAQCIEKMQLWGRRYPRAGYGTRFSGWLRQKHPTPYGSWGNGSAMRVAAAGWLYDTLERTMEAAEATADVSHDHPEGIKGAVCTAAMIFLARTGATKQQMLDFQQAHFGYDLQETLEEMRARHRHDESCMDSLPKSLKAFFEAESFEDAVRNAVSLGGDTDTLAAITGSIAEAFFGIPEQIGEAGLAFLPEDIRAVLDWFRAAAGEKQAERNDPSDNREIRQAADEFRAEENRDTLIRLLVTLEKRMRCGGEVTAPMVDVNHVLEGMDLSGAKAGDTVSLEQDLRLVPDTVRSGGGEEWIPLFTSEAELEKGVTADIRVRVPIESILMSALNSRRAEGAVIDPFGEPVALPKALLRLLFRDGEAERER